MLSRTFIMILTRYSPNKIQNYRNSGCKYPKSRRFFIKINRQVELLCEYVFTVVVKIALQFVMLPKCIGSYAIYFITDSGRDSFQLPIPLWYIYSFSRNLRKIMYFLSLKKVSLRYTQSNRLLGCHHSWVYHTELFVSCRHMLFESWNWFVLVCNCNDQRHSTQHTLNEWSSSDK